MFSITRTSPGEQAAALAATCETLNAFEASVAGFPQVECPVVHTFTPGMYGREITMPADTFVTSKIHKTDHQFVVVSGEVSVWIEGKGIERIKAPYFGITKAGTRRALYTHSDCVWKTFHPTLQTSVATVEEEIIFPHDPHNAVALPSNLVAALAEIK